MANSYDLTEDDRTGLDDLLTSSRSWQWHDMIALEYMAWAAKKRGDDHLALNLIKTSKHIKNIIN